MTERWTRTKLTPPTMPKAWIHAGAAFKHFMDAAGGHKMAVHDMQRALGTGRVKSMVLRKIEGSWQRRTLTPEFWRGTEMGPDFSSKGHPSHYWGNDETQKALRRKEFWTLYLRARSVMAVCYGPPTSSLADVSRERLTKEAAVYCALEALARADKLNGRTDKQICDEINTNHLLSGVTVSMPTFKRGFKKWRNRDDPAN